MFIFAAPLIREHQSVAVINENLVESNVVSTLSYNSTVTTATTARHRALATMLDEAVTTAPVLMLTETMTVTIPTVMLNEDSSVYIEMENILQNPELPTGCEIVALTSLLRFYGFDADKIDMAKNYLPISDGNKRVINGKETNYEKSIDKL
jgi:hypothetical protein